MASTLYLSQYFQSDIMKAEISLGDGNVKKIFLITLAILLITSAVLASPATKTLTKNTDLHPQGWISGALNFKSGTQVTLNNNSEVITGTLTNYEYLGTVGSAYEKEDVVGFFIAPVLHKNIGRIIFRPDVPLTFDDQGRVIKGYIANACSINLVDRKDYYVRFQERTYIEFNNDGSVLQGTIAEDTCLRPIGWRSFLPLDDNAGFLKFQSGTEIQFGPEGQVIKGTIAKDLVVLGIKYPTGTILQFSESGNPQIVK